MTNADKGGIILAIVITAAAVGYAAGGGFFELAPQIAQTSPVIEREPVFVAEPEPEPMAEPEPEPMAEPEPEPMAEPEPEPMAEPEPEPMAEPEPEMLMLVTVILPLGSAAPGCEVTDECFIPSVVKIAAGGEVNWDNVDTVAHTVTSGSPVSGLDGIFDSGLLMAGKSYSTSMDNKGVFEYFCMVHPWMVGTVEVN